jgi:protein-L-isoaspartate(D-aspartate) O-methyltransferase
MLTEIAREQMIEQQVRAWNVLDERTLDTLRRVPRERFTPPAWRELAFADCAIPLAHGKRMLPPMLIGKILQALEIKDGEEILEIGTGSGFLTACLATLGGRVRSLELHADIAASARSNLSAAAAELPIEVVEADGMQLSEEARYDAIVLTASLPLYQTRFERSLRPGGRLFVVVGQAPLMKATLVRRRGATDWRSEVLFETCIEVLEHAIWPPAFGF